MRRSGAGVVEIIQRAIELIVDLLVRIAFRQQPRQRRQMGHAIDRVRGCEQVRRAQPGTFDDIRAEMLVEPRPPHRAHAVSRLQQGPHPRAGAAAHQAQMTAMPTRQEFDDGR